MSIADYLGRPLPGTSPPQSIRNTESTGEIRMKESMVAVTGNPRITDTVRLSDLRIATSPLVGLVSQRVLLYMLPSIIPEIASLFMSHLGLKNIVRSIIHPTGLRLGCRSHGYQSHGYLNLACRVTTWCQPTTSGHVTVSGTGRGEIGTWKSVLIFLSVLLWQ
jgi:hypothetical protein